MCFSSLCVLTLFAINSVNAYIGLGSATYAIQTLFFHYIVVWSIWFDRFLFIILQFSTFSRLITLIDEFKRQFWMAIFDQRLRASICLSNFSFFILWFCCFILYFNFYLFFFGTYVLLENLNKSGTNSAHKCQPPRAKCFQFHSDRFSRYSFGKWLGKFSRTHNNNNKKNYSKNCNLWCQLVYCFSFFFLLLLFF